MAILTRQAILANRGKRRFDTVDVPEFGEGAQVIIRSLNGAERDAYEASIIVGKGKNRDVNLKNLRAKLVSMCVVETDDWDAPPIFTDADVEALGELSAAALDRIFTAAQKLSGLSEDDVEELAKN